MRIGSLAGYLQEAVDDGDAGDETPVVLVLRNPNAGLDDDDAWLEAHLARVERDVDDIDLVATEDVESGLSATELLARISDLAASDPELEVFLRGDDETLDDETIVRVDVPALAFIAKPDEGIVGIMGLFDGWEDVLGDTDA